MSESCANTRQYAQKGFHESEQDSQTDARVLRATAPPSSETEISPFAPQTPKPWPTTKHGVDRMHRLRIIRLYTVTLKLEFRVTQVHSKRHYSIQHIRLYIRLP